jgi:glutathione S-transferase
MKLYFFAGACSQAPHIAARELGIDLELVRFDPTTKTIEGGVDFHTINPKGYVPTLELDDGSILTEVGVILQYLADRAGETTLLPPQSSLDRYRVLEWVAFVSTELHKTFSPLFRADTPEETRRERTEYLHKRLAFVDAALTGRPYLTGEHFTIADAYLFVVAAWARLVKVDLAAYEHLTAFQKRVAERPTVVAARQAEKRRPA